MKYNKKIISNQEGNIIILMGVFILVMVVGAALAVDIGRAQMLKARIQSQVDSATLGAGLAANKNPDITDAELKAKAIQLYNSGFPNGYLNSSTPEFTVTRDADGHIKMTASAKIDTYFAKIINKDTIDAKTESRVLHNVAIPTNIVMALDVTGSMDSILPGSSANKYAGLQLATNNFLDIMKDANSAGQIYIGIVPYTQTVNIGVSGVASVPVGGTNQAPSWNPNSWLSVSDPSLTASYDWGDNPTFEGYSFKTAIGTGWNVVGNLPPRGWGGCVMARNPAVNGAGSGSPLDISDDAPSIAQFHRFYYPSDNWLNAKHDGDAKNGNSERYNKDDARCGFRLPGSKGGGKEVCEEAKDAWTETITYRAAYCDEDRVRTVCPHGEGVCKKETVKGRCYPERKAREIVHPATPRTCRITGPNNFEYNTFKGYNPWMCNSTADGGKTYLINRITNRPSIFDGNSSENQAWNDSDINNTTGPNYTCPMTKDYKPFSIFPMQSANDVGLKDTISKISNIRQTSTYSNATVINIGLSWAWRLISNRWAGLWQDAMDTAPKDWRVNPPTDMKKFVVIMTDGKNNHRNSANTNTSDNLFGKISFTAYGLQSPFGLNPLSPATSVGTGVPDSAYFDNKTLSLCSAMGQAGIVIYTVGFGTVGTGSGTDVNDTLLKTCAESAGGEFFLASNNAALVAAFEKIADSILANLRVTD